jgi:hypothetical protein
MRGPKQRLPRQRESPLGLHTGREMFRFVPREMCRLRWGRRESMSDVSYGASWKRLTSSATFSRSSVCSRLS